MTYEQVWPAQAPARVDARCLVAWREAAIQMGEFGAGASLAEVVPADRTDRNVAGRVALDQVLAGRWEAAAQTLAQAGVTRPEPEPRLADLALAATHAAKGDDDAYRWLTSMAADEPWVQAVVAVVADVRGEQERADALWLAGHDSGAVTMPWNRLVTATILERNRHDLDSISAAVVAAVVLIGRIGGPAEAVEVARNLVARDDKAGARLLLRAYTTLVQRDPRIRAEPARVRPSWHFLPMLSATLVVLGLISFGRVQYVQGHAMSILATVPFIAMALLPRIPIPGLTLPESYLWRAFRFTTWDPDTGIAVRGQHTGWYGLAGIIGAISGFVVGMVALPAAQAGLGQDRVAWETSGASFPTALALAAIGGVVSALVVRRLFTRVEQRRIREQLRQSRLQSGTCHCTSLHALRGMTADDYLRDHLVSRDGSDAPLPGCTVVACPQVGVLWLSGPIGMADAHLLLRGAAPEFEETSVGTARDGFYM